MRTPVASLFLLMLVALPGAVALAQSDKERIFADTDSARSQAFEAQAKEFAPKIWAKAEKEYQKAVGYFERNRDSSRLVEQLNKAEAVYQDAEATASNSQVELSDAIESREAATTVNAAELAPRYWESAEQSLLTAIRQCSIAVATVASWVGGGCPPPRTNSVG